MQESAIFQKAKERITSEENMDKSVVACGMDWAKDWEETMGWYLHAAIRTVVSQGHWYRRQTKDLEVWVTKMTETQEFMFMVEAADQSALLIQQIFSAATVCQVQYLRTVMMSKMGSVPSRSF